MARFIRNLPAAGLAGLGLVAFLRCRASLGSHSHSNHITHLVWVSQSMRRTAAIAVLGTCQALTAYQRLTGATVLSVADRRPVELTSTWQGNERVVVEFLRHFG